MQITFQITSIFYITILFYAQMQLFKKCICRQIFVELQNLDVPVDKNCHFSMLIMQCEIISLSFANR